MTREEARRLVAATTTPEAARGAAMHAGAVEAYRAASPAEQTRLAEAMWTLLDGGEDWERTLASGFFAGIIVPDELRKRIVDAYVERGWTSEDPAGSAVASFSRTLTAAERKALRGVYLAEPARQDRLAELLLPGDDDGAVWRALAARLEASDDPRTLLRGLDAVTVAPSREADYYALLCAKGETVVRAVGAMVGPRTRQRMLAACGLK